MQVWEQEKGREPKFTCSFILPPLRDGRQVNFSSRSCYSYKSKFLFWSIFLFGICKLHSDFLLLITVFKILFSFSVLVLYWILFWFSDLVLVDFRSITRQLSPPPFVKLRNCNLVRRFSINSRYINLSALFHLFPPSILTYNEAKGTRVMFFFPFIK